MNKKYIFQKNKEVMGCCVYINLYSSIQAIRLAEKWVEINFDVA